MFCNCMIYVIVEDRRILIQDQDESLDNLEEEDKGVDNTEEPKERVKNMEIHLDVALELPNIVQNAVHLIHSRY